MPPLEPSSLLSPPLEKAVPTNTNVNLSITRDYGREDGLREKWQNLIDHKLIAWGCDPSQFADEGVEPPSGETIQRAIRLAKELGEKGKEPPDSVVPDVNGGIVFERREGDVSEVFHVWDDGSVEYYVFRGTRLVDRWML